MFAGSKAAVAMTQESFRHMAALVLLGIAIGCAISHFYFTAFLSDRAEDGMPIAMGEHLYRVTEVSRPVMWQGGNMTSSIDCAILQQST